MTRQEAWQLVCEWMSNENLRKHLLAVEAAMRFYARKFGEDEEKWGLVGLLHDLDYERHPNPPEHPQVGVNFLKERGLPDDMVQAILAHADWKGLPRETLMAKVLYACDELTGFLVACAFVMPNKKLSEVKVDTVVRKMKDKSFARKVNREEIIKGTEELGIPLEEHIGNVLKAMNTIADKLNL